MKRLSWLFFAALLLVGCRQVEFKNGEVPAEYLEQAKKMEGTYRGSFAGYAYDLKIQLDGNRPRLSFNPLSEKSCPFQFGDILTANVEENSDKTVDLTAVTFDLESEGCFSAQGRELSLDISQRDGRVFLNASLMLERYWEQVCYWTPGTPYERPRYECRSEPRTRYLTGRFSR